MDDNSKHQFKCLGEDEELETNTSIQFSWKGCVSPLFTFKGKEEVFKKSVVDKGSSNLPCYVLSEDKIRVY